MYFAYELSLLKNEYFLEFLGHNWSYIFDHSQNTFINIISFVISLKCPNMHVYVPFHKLNTRGSFLLQTKYLMA